MKLNKEKFMKTEMGGELEETIRTWDKAIDERRKATPGIGNPDQGLGFKYWDNTCRSCQDRWEVFKLAIKQFYGIEFFFTRTDEYFGVCSEDESMTATAGIVQKAASQSMAQPVLDSSNEVRKIEAPATVQSRSSVIGETIGTLTGDRQQGKSKQDEQPMKFVFSPTYHFEGEAPSKEDIVEANRMSQAEFEKLMKEWMKKHKRISFA